MSSPRENDSQNESDKNTNSNVIISIESSSEDINHNNNDGQTNVTSSDIKFPQPAIIRKPSNNQISDENPPPYSIDSNMQIPTQSHHTEISFTYPPDYLTITKQPQAIPHPSHHNGSLSDTSINNGSLNDGALLSSAQPSKFCKICQESEQSFDETDSDHSNRESHRKGKLISPCKCKGSLQYVHVGCLDQWRHSNIRPEASYRCEVCRYEYKFYRPRVAKVFSNFFTIHFLSLSLLLSIIYLTSYLVKLASSNDTTPDLPGEQNWKHIQILNLRLIHVVIGLFIVSLFGFIFFAFIACFRGVDHTRNNYLYCGGCDYYACTGCYCGGLSVNDCADCGGCCVMIFLIIILVIFMFGFAGAVIAVYLLIQKIMVDGLGKVHDRILEVEKD